MLYASRRALRKLRAFLNDKTVPNWTVAVREMKKDLYI